MPPSKKQKSEPDAHVPVEFHEPKVMAEIGCNHMGNIEIAKELLTLAKQCGCEYGKFQKRCPKELLTPEQYSAPHPNPRNSYGDTYGAHREFLELSVEQHGELKKHCDEIGLGYSCSVWDLTSAKEISSLKPDLIKVGSPSNQHWELQTVLRDEYDGDVHISTGMTTKEEIEKIVSFWEAGKGDAKNRLILYNCTSGYPVPFEDVACLSCAGCTISTSTASSTLASRATTSALPSTSPHMRWEPRGTSVISRRTARGREPTTPRRSSRLACKSCAVT